MVISKFDSMAMRIVSGGCFRSVTASHMLSATWRSKGHGDAGKWVDMVRQHDNRECRLYYANVQSCFTFSAL